MLERSLWALVVEMEVLWRICHSKRLTRLGRRLQVVKTVLMSDWRIM